MFSKQEIDERIEAGINGFYDELIDKHLSNLYHPPFDSNIRYFLETGKINGSFLEALRNMLKEHDKICEENGK